MRQFRNSQILLRQNRRSSASSRFTPKPIATLPDFLHRHLFPSVEVPPTASKDDFATKLKSLELPRLTEDNLIDHFEKVALQKMNPYLAQIDEIISWDLNKYDQLIPTRKSNGRNFVFKNGWTRYDHKTGDIREVPHPLEPCMVFDVEVCVSDSKPKGKLPTMATALTSEAWYSWCSDRLIKNVSYATYATQDKMIPLSTAGKYADPRLVVGHNVGYDRARTREPYLRQRSGIRYFDTLSAAASILGMADHQQGLYMKDDLSEPKHLFKSYMLSKDALQLLTEVWRNKTSKLSLKELGKFLCENDSDSLSQRIASMKKIERDFFVTQPIEFFRDENNFNECMAYCAFDVIATTRVFQKLMPQFKEMYPSPITSYGFLNMGDAYLPINRYWPQFYYQCEKQMHDLKQEAAQNIVACAKSLLNSVKIGSDDIWLWTESWNTSSKNSTPKWYREMFTSPGKHFLPPDKIQDKDVKYGKLVPKIFGMAYRDYPLYDHPEFGWGYLVPTAKCAELRPEDNALPCDNGPEIKFPAWNVWKNWTWPKEELTDNKDALTKQLEETGSKPTFVGPFLYRQLKKSSKHKSEKVATPFAITYQEALNKNELKATRFHEEYKCFLDAFFSTKFWVNYSKRYGDEIHVWYPEECEIDLSKATDATIIKDEPKMVGALAPGIRPAGTVTRRAVHPLWVTMTNVKNTAEYRIGTHLKSMIQAPPGYCIIGADVDSQEQWLAAIMGDASDAAGLDLSERRAGRTPFSNMALVGQKSDASDLHSVVANDLGIKRDTAKTLNYARLYGAGRGNAESTLIESGIEPEKAHELAIKVFETTKGKELWFRELKSSIVPYFLQFCKTNSIDGYLRVAGKTFIPDYRAGFNECERHIGYEFEEWMRKELEARGLWQKGWTNDQHVPRLYQDFRTSQRFFIGGYESSTFNYLVWCARQEQMSTPVLKCALGSGLSLPKDIKNKERRQLFLDMFMRSRMNWVVQSSAVDFLHLLLLCMDWLCNEYDINARFMISIHDEVRYLCKDEDAARCALALMWSNAYVRATISDVIGIPQLPLNIAFFSQVDVDTVLRKEVDTPCKNPDGTEPKNGEAWNMETILNKTGGRLSKQE